MTQFQFYKSFLFVVELLLAEFCYLNQLKHKNFFPLRAIGCTAAVFLAAFLLPSDIENTLYKSGVFLLIFLFTVLASFTIYKENFFTVAFCCIAGYTTQHLAYELYNLLLLLVGFTDNSGFYGVSDFWLVFPNIVTFVLYLCAYFIVYFVCYWLFARNVDKDGVRIQRMMILFFAVFIFVVDNLLNMLVVYNPVEGARLYRIIIGVLNMLCCFVSLYLQFEVALRKKIENEFDAMQHIWEEKKKQYEISKQNIDLINMKCHDLRYRIRNMGGQSVIPPEAIDDVAHNIRIYDSVVKTGNVAIDTILTEKSLLCNKEQINLECIIDGEQLSFMSAEDIYILFGNIVDNAVEAVGKLPQEMRIISLHVRKVNQMLLVHECNYFDGEIVFENGLPKTKKADKNYHGIGTKSIKYICEKYGGSVRMCTKENRFFCDLLFFPQSGNDSI